MKSILIKGIILAVFIAVSLQSYVWYNSWKRQNLSQNLLNETLSKAGCLASASEKSWVCETQVLQILSEEALVWRSEALKLYAHLSGLREKNERPLTSEEITLIHSGVKYYSTLRLKLYGFVERIRPYLHANIKFDVNAAEGISIDVTDKAGRNSDDVVITINPHKNDGRELVERLRMALVAGLTLYDNYIYGIYPYQSDKFFRRLINQDHQATEDALREAAANVASLKNLFSVYHGIQIHKEYLKSANLDDSSKNLTALIESSPTYHMLLRSTAGEMGVALQTVDWFEELFRDKLDSFKTEILGLTSKTFGNSVGIVETRKGKLYDKPQLTRLIQSQLQPLDILLEKTPFRLTDKFIPGYWGHAAVWAGTEEDLNKANLWGHASVVKHQNSIRSGHNVIEALRSGVQLSPLSHFLNIDDLMVVRIEGLNEADKADYLVRAYEQLGKEYDFNFDVETDLKIVCSELIYVTFFKNFIWPTEKVLGRATISPDNIVRLTSSDPRFKIIALYIDGINTPPERAPKDAF